MYQNSSDTMRYVPIAKMSHTSGLRHCGHTFMMFGVGHEPVEEPRPAEVQDRQQARHRDGEERHRLGEAVDRRAPLLAQQQQERGDERAGMADADPPDEVGDREAPGDRDVDAPDADALARTARRSRRRTAASAGEANAKPATSAQCVGRVRTMPAILSVIASNSPSRRAQHVAVPANRSGVACWRASVVPSSSGFGVRTRAR